MKKLLTILSAFALVATLAACTPETVEVIKEVEVPVEKIVEVEAAPVEIPAVVNMENIDLYVERVNTQLVDLRDAKDLYASGYIQGATNISFFEFLENYALTRSGDWAFSADEITDAFILENFFDKDADAIFLYCGSGTRAGYVKAALEELGYDNVYNVGGFADYSSEGAYYVFGDGEYTDKAIPAVVDMTNVDKYLSVDGVQLVDLRNFADLFTSGYIQGATNIPFFQFLEAEGFLVRDGDWTFEADEILDAAILENYFDKDATAIFLYCGSGTRAGYVKAALEELGYDNVYNVGGFANYPQTSANYVYAGIDAADFVVTAQ